MTDNDLLNFLFKDPLFYDKGLISSESWSGDTISLFIKKYRPSNQAEWSIEKEINAMTFLQKCKEIDATIDWFPEMIWYNENTIVFQHVGEKLTPLNIPDNYQSQFDKIFSDLVLLQIMHNKMIVDPSGREFDTEFTVLNNKMYLVDYGGHLKRIKNNSIGVHLYDTDLDIVDFSQRLSVEEYKKIVDDYLNKIYKIKKDKS